MKGFSILAGCLGVGYYVWFIYFSLKNKTDITPEDTKQEEDVESLEVEELKEEVPVRKGITYLVLGSVAFSMLTLYRRILNFLIFITVY